MRWRSRARNDRWSTLYSRPKALSVASLLTPATVFKPGGHVTAGHLGEDHLDLFAADRNGVVRSIWWNSDNGYRAEGWFALGPEKKTAPGAQVTALWADANISTCS